MPTKKTSDSEQTTENVDQEQNNTTPDAPKDPQGTTAPEQPAEEKTPDTRSTAELANEVLNGHFGDFNVVRQNLDDAGLDSTAVLTLVNERLSRGAPSVYRPNVSHVLDSARRGEWGSKNVGLRVRAAGFSELDASHVESEYNKDS